MKWVFNEFFYSKGTAYGDIVHYLTAHAVIKSQYITFLLHT